MKNKTLGALCLIIAIVSAIFAIICFNMETGSWELLYEYGGDAYTGIQNSAAETANNIKVLNENIKTIACFAFVICALTFGSIGISNLTNKEYDKYDQDEDDQKRTKSTNDSNNTTDNTCECYCCGALIQKDIRQCPNCGERFNR